MTIPVCAEGGWGSYRLRWEAAVRSWSNLKFKLQSFACLLACFLSFSPSLFLGKNSNMFLPWGICRTRMWLSCFFFSPPPAVGEAKLKGGLILPQGTTFFSYEIVPAFFPSLSPATEILQSQAGTDPSCRECCEIREFWGHWEWGSFGQRGGEDRFPPVQGVIAIGDSELLIWEHLL